MELDSESNGAAATYEQSAPTGGKELDRTFSLLLRQFNLLTVSLFRFYLALCSRTPVVQCSGLHIGLHGVDGILHRRMSLLSSLNVVPLQPPPHTLSVGESSHYNVLMIPGDFQSATKNIELIVNNILASEREKLDLRMGLVHYRSVPAPRLFRRIDTDACDDAAIIHRKIIPTLPDFNK